MAATPEAKVKAKVKAILQDYGAYHFFPIATGMGRAGIPDIICCVDGLFLAIECKAGKGKVTLLQGRELMAIKAAGGCAVVVNEESLPQLPTLLETLKKCAKTIRLDG